MMKDNPNTTLNTAKEGIYPIRTVSEVTGVNAITLRAWERRYGLFNPQRTPKGHRLYSPKDILRIQQVLQLLEKGIAIGRVANALKNTAPLEELPDLTLQNGTTPSIPDDNTPLENKNEPTGDQWRIYHNKIMAHINTYDLAKLEQLHHEVFSLYPVDIVSRTLIFPVISELQKQAEQLQSLAGHYHFYWHYLQQRLGGMFLRSTLQNHGKKLVLISYGNEKSDIELTLFGLPLVTHGYRVVLLGCDLPFDALPMMLSHSNSDGLIIYTDAMGSNTKVNIAIISSIKTVADSFNVPIFVTSHISDLQRADFFDQGIIVLPEGSADQIKLLNEAMHTNKG